MSEPTPEQLEKEQEMLSDLQDLILDRYPSYEERPGAVQELLLEVGERWNEVTTALSNYERWGSFEAPEMQGSGMSVYDSIHTGSR